MSTVVGLAGGCPLGGIAILSSHSLESRNFCVDPTRLSDDDIVAAMVVVVVVNVTSTDVGGVISMLLSHLLDSSCCSKLWLNKGFAVGESTPGGCCIGGWGAVSSGEPSWGFRSAGFVVFTPTGPGFSSMSKAKSRRSRQNSK